MSEDGPDYYLAERLQANDRDAALVEVFVPPPERAAFRALLVSWFEFRDLLYATGEPEVGLARLGWWREEWARLAEGRARHPLTTRLGTLAQFAADDVDRGLLGVARLLQMESCDRWDDVERAVAEIAAAMGRIEERLAGVRGDRAAAIWHDLISADLRIGLPLLLGAGRAMLPMDLSAALQVSRRDLRARTPVGDRVVAHLATEWKPRAAGPVPGGNAWIYRAVVVKRLAASRAGAVEPGSLRKLLAAWRGARRLRRLGVPER